MLPVSFVTLYFASQSFQGLSCIIPGLKTSLKILFSSSLSFPCVSQYQVLCKAARMPPLVMACGMWHWQREEGLVRKHLPAAPIHLLGSVVRSPLMSPEVRVRGSELSEGGGGHTQSKEQSPNTVRHNFASSCLKDHFGRGSRVQLREDPLGLPRV